MSKWHTCNKCKLYVIGSRKCGCILCNKVNISLKINSRNYANSLLGLPLPLDLILYISQIASSGHNYVKLLQIHEQTWKARMQGMREIPGY